MKIKQLLWMLFLSSFTTIVAAQEFPPLQPITVINASALVQLDMPVLNGIIGKARAISHDGAILIVQETDRVSGWDLENGTLVFEVPCEYYFYAVAEFSSDDHIVAIVVNGRWYLIDLTTQVQTFTRGPVASIAFSVDGHSIGVAYGFDRGSCPDCGTLPSNSANRIEIIHVASGEIRANIWREDSEMWGFSGIAFSPDGNYLAAVSPQRRVYLWSVPALLDTNQTPLANFYIDDQGGDIIFSPDNTQLAASYALIQTGGDGYARLNTFRTGEVWDVDALIQNQPEAETYPSLFTLQTGLGGARSITYSPNGDLILTYGEYGWASLSNAQTGEVVITLELQEDFVITPDSRLLIVSDEQGNLSYWGVLDG